MTSWSYDFSRMRILSRHVSSCLSRLRLLRARRGCIRDSGAAGVPANRAIDGVHLSSIAGPRPAAATPHAETPCGCVRPSRRLRGRPLRRRWTAGSDPGRRRGKTGQAPARRTASELSSRISGRARLARSGPRRDGAPDAIVAHAVVRTGSGGLTRSHLTRHAGYRRNQRRGRRLRACQRSGSCCRTGLRADVVPGHRDAAIETATGRLRREVDATLRRYAASTAEAEATGGPPWSQVSAGGVGQRRCSKRSAAARTVRTAGDAIRRPPAGERQHCDHAVAHRAARRPYGDDTTGSSAARTARRTSEKTRGRASSRAAHSSLERRRESQVPARRRGQRPARRTRPATSRGGRGARRRR